MLVVLSEINCLNHLNKYGVYPDEFYTDFDLFKSNSLLWQDATVIIICAGNCRFNKRLIVELIKSLSARISTEADNSVTKLYAITDVSLPDLSSYYKYENNLDKMDLMKGWKVVKSGINIWGSLKGVEKKTAVFLSKFNNGDYINSEQKTSIDDEYIPLIKVPKLEF